MVRLEAWRGNKERVGLKLKKWGLKLFLRQSKRGGRVEEQEDRNWVAGVRDRFTGDPISYQSDFQFSHRIVRYRFI